MQIIKEGKLNKLIAETNYLLKSKGDNYTPAYIDAEGNQIEEHLPYGFEYAYIPDSITLEIAQTMYDELLASEYPWGTKTTKATEEDYLNALAKLGVE